MTTRGEMRKMSHMVNIIREEGRIGKIQLVIRSGISNSYYEKLRPYMEAMFTDIEYDRGTKTWRAVKVEDVPQKNREKPQEMSHDETKEED